MARVVDHPISDQSSDSEEINKLFPKCRPRVPNMVNDVNQNSVMNEDKQITSSSQVELSTLDRANDNIMMSHDCDYQQSPSSDLDQNDSPSSGKDEKIFVGRAGDGSEDQSVVSAYDRYGYEHFIFPAVREERCGSSEEKGDFCREIVYDDELDVGYHLNHRAEHGVCESRIEIAGGREIFSASRSRPSKKRHSDEVVYHPPPQNYEGIIQTEHKRHSGEVLYDDRLKRFMYHVHASPSTGKKSHSVERISHATQTCEGVTSRDDNHYISDHHGTSFRIRKMSPTKLQPNVVDEPLEHTLASGHVVYETPVLNAEVIYDDIGDLICQQKPDQSNILQVKPVIKCEEVPCSEIPDHHEEYFEEKGEELQVSSNSQTYSHNSDKAMILSYASNNINNSKSNEVQVSYCNDESPGNFSPEEVMDTESEPSSPTKLGIARVIGNVPIAQYEGSPRRYGPRPGYPQRIIAGDQQLKDSAATNSNSVCEEIGNADPSIKCSINSSKLHADMDNSLQGISLRQIKDAFQCSTDKQHPDKIGSDGYCGSDTSRGPGECQQDEQDDSKSPSLEPDFSELEYKLYRVNSGSSYVGKRLAQSSCGENQDSPKRSEKVVVNGRESSNHGCELVSPDRPLSSEISAYIPNEHELMLLHERVHQHTLHVEMAEQDRESLSTYPGTEDLGETEVGEQVDNTRNFTLSPETTDCDSNEVESEVSLEGSLNSGGRLLNSMPVLEDGLSSGQSSDAEELDGSRSSAEEGEDGGEMWRHPENRTHNTENKTMLLMKQQINEIEQEIARRSQKLHSSRTKYQDVEEFLRQQDCRVQHSPLQDIDISYFDTLRHDSNHNIGKVTNYSKHSSDNSLPEIENSKKESVTEAIREIKQAIRRSKGLQLKTVPNDKQDTECQPIWVPRLSQSSKGTRTEGSKDGQPEHGMEEECDTDQETDRLLGAQRSDDRGFFDDKGQAAAGKKKNTSREVLIHEPEVLIEGVLFRARYLGSTQLVCEGQPTKATRMMQAEEAVSRIKAPEGETQPSPEVDLFISTEKIMVLNTDLKEIMMDHALRTISYIADIGDLVVLMARRRVLNSPEDPTEPKIKRTPKMICHVFESEEAQFIAQSIGQAFQVAYMEFLKANGIEDSSFLKEMDYREVLNSQEIFGNELEMFAKKEKQKEVIVPKAKGEILGMVIVESGWGSMLPTVVIANMAQSGPAARCAQLNIGDQIIAINGISLVGLPLSTCQDYIKNTRNQTVVKLTVVPCTPVVEVKIKRPDTKYQLGFSVQNGVICSLLRGGIAERGGVRVGHRIIEINGQSVVAVPHEKIVNLLATSVGEIHMKTMPTSMFRLLTGQETPVYI